ncbi:MAG: epoxyqueuosine reductase [Firmicutes bacterium]|nr:epoxyqueuosine reductase [Bacillota bacterium]
MEAHCGKVIGDFLRERGYQAVAAPKIPVKPAAVRAGLGRYGRHTVVITPELGSWVMFACILTDAPLACTDAPLDGTVCPEGCDACRRACPTGALTGPYKISRAKCITGWLWGNFVPAGLREKQETRLFGCGECLLVCPRNERVAPRRSYPVPIDEFCDSPELIPLLEMAEDEFRRLIPAFPRQAGIDAIRGNASLPWAISAIRRPCRRSAAPCGMRKPRSGPIPPGRSDGSAARRRRPFSGRRWPGRRNRGCARRSRAPWRFSEGTKIDIEDSDVAPSPGFYPARRRCTPSN